MPTFPRRLIAIAAFALCSGHALAVEPFKVKDIRIEGIHLIEKSGGKSGHYKAEN